MSLGIEDETVTDLEVLVKIEKEREGERAVGVSVMDLVLLVARGRGGVVVVMMSCHETGSGPCLELRGPPEGLQWLAAVGERESLQRHRHRLAKL